MISLFLGIFLLWKVDFDDVVIKDPNWYALLIIPVSTSGAYLFRALFYRKSVKAPNLRIRDFFAVTGIFNFVSSILPFNIGNLSYPVLLKKYYDLGLERGASSLLIYAFARIIVLLTGLTIAVLLLGVFTRFVEVYLVLVACFAVAFSFVIVFLNRIEKINLFRRYSVLSIFLRMVMAVKQELKKLASTAELLWLFILAIAVGVFNLVSLWFSFYFMGYSIPIVGVVYIWSAANLGSLLPIHGIAGFGSYEAINTFILLSLGLSTNEAIQMSFVVHVVSLLVQASLALCSWLFINKFAEEISNTVAPVGSTHECEN